MEDRGIMDATCSADDVGEAAPVADDAMEDDEAVSLAADEYLDALEQAGDEGDVHGTHVIGEAHVAETGNHLLPVAEEDEAVGQDVLDNWICL